MEPALSPAAATFTSNPKASTILIWGSARPNYYVAGKAYTGGRRAGRWEGQENGLKEGKRDAGRGGVDGAIIQLENLM